VFASYRSSSSSKALTVDVAARFPLSVAQVCRLLLAPEALSMHRSLVVALLPLKLLGAAKSTNEKNLKIERNALAITVRFFSLVTSS
jgi:hypothetical protein